VQLELERNGLDKLSVFLFKVPKFKGEKIPGFRTKKEKGETIFIEPKRKRIKRGTKEIPELQYWKGIKSPIKKLKGGKRK